MHFMVIILYAVGAILPIIGFTRLLRRVHHRVRDLDRLVAERGVSNSTWADFNAHYARDVRAPFWEERRDLIWDTCLIGAGLLVGAAAGVWSLYL